jgi:Leucine-rich repeat (LRR) protein
MIDENAPSPASLPDSLLLPRQDRHYLPLLAAIPSWLGTASATKREALKKADPRLSASLKRASRDQHDKLRALNAAHWTAQNPVDQSLARLQDAKSFAAPLLHDEIKRRFGLNLDVTQVFLRLYIPAHIPWLRLKSGAARTWTVSLLDAALHNFEDSETGNDAFESASGYISQPSAQGHFSHLPNISRQMPIPVFAQLCRELNIGKRYTEYLQDNLGISNPVVAAVLQPNVCASEKAALVAALQMAHMQNLLGGDLHRLILGVLEGLQHLRLNRQAWQCHALTIMNVSLTGIVLFAPDLENATVPSRVVAYIPDDPLHPVKEYPDTGALAQELTLRLRDPDYQVFFSRFVNHQDRGHFFSQLNALLKPIMWQPVPSGDSRPNWREGLPHRLRLQMASTPINGDLWIYLYQRKLDKILNDAQVIAVSTASVDRKARWALWDSFMEIASVLLNVVTFVAMPFVPFLGELMLAYTAYQLLDETFESIVDWAEGLPREAFEHFMGAVESVVQVGTFAAGGALAAGEFRALLPTKIIDFIDRFIPADLPNGKSRYWKPDLRPYEQHEPLPQDAKPNALGLHTHRDKTLLMQENKRYAVSLDPQTNLYRIDHPARPDAYKPALTHNDAGAWQTELDQPLIWDRNTLLRRCGADMQRLSVSQRERLLDISGCNENNLRQMHLEQRQLPPLLADTLERWLIDQDIERFIEQVGSDSSADYLQADAATQLQLLYENGYWPANKGLQLIDGRGKTLWRSSASNVTFVRMNASRLINGDLLESCLQGLSESEIRTLLGEDPYTTAPTLESRTRTLRRKVTDLARRKRQSLFGDRYREQQRGAGLLTQTLMDKEPDLPKKLAHAILDIATDAERLRLQGGSLTARLVDLTRETALQVRTTRALEGLELQAITNNLDTDKLALHTLPRLPGWSGTVRLEIRDQHQNGRLIDSIGSQNAPERKILVLTEQGEYQPFDDAGASLSPPGQLFPGLLQALPDAERCALNIHIGEAEKLKRLIQQHTLNREDLRTLLSQQPTGKPAYDRTVMTLLGATNGVRRLATNTPTLQTHAHWLLPHLLPEELGAFVERLQRHPNGPRNELSRLIAERTRLDEVLNPWVDAIALINPDTEARLDTEQYAIQQHRRRQMRVDILDCWKQQIALPENSAQVINLQLSLPIRGELPKLDVNFARVQSLTIEGAGSTQHAHRFLNCFSGLQHLTLRNLRLDYLPETVSLSPQLRELVLSDCALTLTPESRGVLAAQAHLHTLDLYKNPLGLPPDVENMPYLRYIDVSETGILELPAGLLTRPQLRTALLNNNQIQTLPPALFELPNRVLEGFDLGGNPIATADRERIKRHFKETRQDFGVMAEPSDLSKVQALYTNMDREEASEFFYFLPGTLAEGRIELERLETEFLGLRDSLTNWTTEIPAIHPVSGEPFTIEEVVNEYAARQEFKGLVEQCWRRETDADDFNPEDGPSYDLNLSSIITGELPGMNADFSHVSHLYMRSRPGRTSGIARFLQAFPNLKGLKIYQYRLESVPEEVFRMASLTYLSLSECHITLTEQSALKLAQIDRLVHLDLSDNPLGRAPDVSQMRDLSTLLLDNTGITELPPGLLQLDQTEVVALNDNAITEITSEILELPAEHAEKISLRNNPLSAASIGRLIAYFKQQRIDFGVQAVIDQAEMEVSSSEDSEVDE